VGFLLGLVCSYSESRAAGCGFPVVVPKYEVGEEWTWKNDKGREWTNRVMEIEGESTAIRWPEDNLAYYNKDWVVEKVKKSSGELVDKQGAGIFGEIGQKIVDFPLEPGKKWSWSNTSRSIAGGDLRIYTNYVKVAGCEETKTPSGTYPAVKLEVYQKSNVSSGGGTYYLWWSPGVKNYVKRNYENSRWWGSGVTDYELIKYEPKK
jgi:hypothetical protein